MTDNDATTTTRPRPFGGSHAGYEKNLARGGSEDQCCMLCGKLTPNPKFWGYSIDGGEFDLEDPRGGYKGHVMFYPLGSECARKIKRLVPVYKSVKSADGSIWPSGERA